jgi:succinyl-diaminopimelate desuccinylase
MTPSSPRARLEARLAESRDRLVALAQSLVRIASPTPPGDTRAVARAASDLLREIPGAEVSVITAAEPFANVVARVTGRGAGRRLVFNGHFDTFPLAEELAWTRPPLSGAVEDGRLYGRGVSDMKGGMACSLLAFQLLAELRDGWSGELVVTLAADEESMGTLGTKHLLDTVPHATGDAMICGDVGSPSIVRFGEKGLLWLEIVAAGRPAHGAHVHLGVNAVDRLRRALDALDDLRALPVEAPPAVTRSIAEAREASERISGAGEAEVLGSLTINLGTVAGGVSTNLVPAEARATADIRLPVGLAAASVERRIGELLDPLEGISWRVLRRFDPSWTDPGHEIVRRVVDNATAVLGRAPAVNMRVGASDSRWYRMAGVPTVVYGLTPYNMGAADEHVRLDELHQVARVHTLTAFDFLSAPAG